MLVLRIILMSPGSRTTPPVQNEWNAQSRSADFQSAVSPSFTRQGVECGTSQRVIARSAECNSAIRQIKNLRYDLPTGSSDFRARFHLCRTTGVARRCGSTGCDLVPCGGKIQTQ